jgi:hypothetical protein
MPKDSRELPTVMHRGVQERWIASGVQGMLVPSSDQGLHAAGEEMR